MPCVHIRFLPAGFLRGIATSRFRLEPENQLINYRTVSNARLGGDDQNGAIARSFSARNVTIAAPFTVCSAEADVNLIGRSIRVNSHRFTAFILAHPILTIYVPTDHFLAFFDPLSLVFMIYRRLPLARCNSVGNQSVYPDDGDRW